ncbi:MAG: 4-hydroxy-3-methylbut-2-enyl diphosphate reductase [Halothiobacillus sp. 14-56-357]|jgi:4-hydroxy-3-methylbut-2-enyl diphosphate reductase|uniref:4-hydroxy-3-methylbut-2-enyl diphosphate reductase n=1 Tax=Halothiobacillus sp. 15-55-196 TaxID=1970382 RepID=UPI000BC67B06|nr:4-hydroxy-3-methylbut-2-enyl diphosphate reductase [Halothiobacillus sp. 15-55-196]OZB36581.1 MAG: 4-hydroxy-3-methylbut-2-enyl diphosphate reductase [Halothiobacillus sp. 15-55-196]OZB56244.1 MAG: 4-hydroxy-3-methylbut-2-enyl diphosphate reductase [Halothiobacillus sp. 14-56-357]OZB79013.1 MAG: 4-hydroxy-3-methylbut-2-enyl diphosphate reductase [Halothiobacillus sp. 13-55-115]
MNILLANPRGFCAGVDRAVEIVDRALDLFGAPIFVRHEIVHNRYIVENLKRKGAIFIEELAEVPDDATLIFSAHGVSRAIEDEAAARGLRIFDATCPLVTKVHLEVERHARLGRDVVLIGHAGHPEVEGTMGHFDPRHGGRIHLIERIDDVANLSVENPNGLAYSTQTTLSVDETQMIIAALRQRFPEIEGPKKDDICYATQNRQDAVRELTQTCDVILVVGSKTSSNSNRLREIAEQAGKAAYLIDGVEDISEDWFGNCACVGVTAGASAPEILVQRVLAHLQTQHNATMIETPPQIIEHMVFALPKSLRA